MPMALHLAMVSAKAIASDVTYDSLSAAGRPGDFYQLTGLNDATIPAHCQKLAAALNEPYPHGSYDLKDVLLFSRYAVHWEEQGVFRSSRFSGKVFVSPSSVPSAPRFLLHTFDAIDNPVDHLYLLRADELEAVRREDNKLDATQLKALLAHENNDRWLVPRIEWQREHQRRESKDATNFAPNYHWADLVIIDEKTYALFASPPAFDDKLNLRGVFDIFLASVSADGIGPGDCRLTHP